MQHCIKKKYILVDMTWWIGGSRKRGIGIYLEALYKHYFDWEGMTPVWIFPRKLSVVENNLFQQEFVWGEITNVSNADYSTLSTISQKQIPSESVAFAISGSPFERPRSLLNDVEMLNAANIPLQIVVHDLLPLDFPRQILATWSNNDQDTYKKQLALLPLVDRVLSTGHAALTQIDRHFPKIAARATIIPFGEQAAWFTIPNNDASVLPPLNGPYAVTIAGGEWRKNLQGTLQFFALKLPKKWRLVVICKLGRREKVAFQLLALSYGLWGRIVWAGEVSDDSKWQYLKSALVLLSLSYGEGLNLPLLEAKAVGIPSMTLDAVRAVYNRPFSKPLFSAK